jgi:hypothetical protein
VWFCGGCALVVKHCASCNTVKSLEEFRRSNGKKSGRFAHCRACTSAKWSTVDDEVRSRAKRGKLSLSYEEYQQMREDQGDRCAICGNPETTRQKGKDSEVRELAIDHDHVTGRVRELLCANCNKALGCMADDPARLRAAADYIEKHAAT